METIGERAFSDCGNLKGIPLPDGLEKIGQKCFHGTAITEFLAPSSLREIGDRAFACCGSLERVVLNEGLEKIKSETFCND